MTRYRKKPVVIEAYQMTRRKKAGQFFWPEWLVEANQREPQTIGSLFMAKGQMHLATPERVMCVSEDDWIIRGVKGELYLCKPDIFEMTYEEITE
jgi:hypothetical protein